MRTLKSLVNREWSKTKRTKQTEKKIAIEPLLVPMTIDREKEREGQRPKKAYIEVNTKIENT